MSTNSGLLLRILENRAGSFTMSLPVLALLLLLIMFGELHCEVPIYERVLQTLVAHVPEVKQLEEDAFADVDPRAYEDFLAREALPEPLAAPERRRDETIVPKPQADLTSRDDRIEVVQVQIDVEELSRKTPAPTPTPERPRDPGPTLADRGSTDIQVRDVTGATGDSAPAISQPVARPSSGLPAPGTGGQGIAATGQGPVIRLEGGLGPGVGGGGGEGMRGRISQAAQAFRDWILRNQAPLPEAVCRALEFDNHKDVTARARVDYENSEHELFFLYRQDENLLRVVVLRGREAFQFDLPRFVLEAKWVKSGTVELAPNSEDPRRLIPVLLSLQPVSGITGEMEAIMGIVLRWLEVSQ